MYFIVDPKRKVIFGWSAKAGCTHIKKYWLKLIDDDVYGEQVHQDFFYRTSLPGDVEDYVVIFFIRNPYKRVVSAYLDRWCRAYGLKHCFEECLKLDPVLVDLHHFCPQLSEQYTPRLKPTLIYDIENINYEKINALFGKPKDFAKDLTRGCHIQRYDTNFREFVGRTSSLKVIPTYEYFYDKRIAELVHDYYKVDFTAFSDWGFDYLPPGRARE